MELCVTLVPRNLLCHHAPPVDDVTVLPTPDLGIVTKLSDKPGCYLRYEGRRGHIYSDQSYSDVLIPVLYHGTVASGVDKCDLCHFHLDGTCCRGQCCTYAHSWAERLEWMPYCTKDGELDCDTKWQHILQYKCIGEYAVTDGRTVGEFLETT